MAMGSDKQRSEDVFLLGAVTFHTTGVVNLSLGLRVPRSCIINRVVGSIPTAAGGTLPSGVMSLFRRAQGTFGIPSGGTKILGTGAVGFGPSGAAHGTNAGNGLDGTGASSATNIIYYPSAGAAGISSYTSTANWRLDRGDVVSVQVIRPNADVIVPITVQIWANAIGEGA